MDMREKAVAGFAASVAFSLLAGGLPVSFIGNMANAQDLPQQVASADVGVTNPGSRVQETREAQAFFTQLASENDNPVIQAMAKKSLQQLKDNGRTGDRPEGVSRHVEVVTNMQLNSSLAVPTLINGKTMATFLVDTGASYTVITPRMAKKAGIVITADTPRISMATANGVVQAPLVTLDKIAIGQVEVENIQVVVQPLGGANDVLLAGLLGMNFFKNMDLTVRQNKLVLDIHDE